MPLMREWRLELWRLGNIFVYTQITDLQDNGGNVTLFKRKATIESWIFSEVRPFTLVKTELSSLQMSCGASVID
jgi:hypothetical protein